MCTCKHAKIGVEFVWGSYFTPKSLVYSTQASCTAQVTKSVTMENLVTKCFFTCQGNQNGCKVIWLYQLG